MVEKIRVTETDDDGNLFSLTHYDPAKGTPADYTLCGLDTAGDPTIGLHGGTDATGKVDCPACISIVKHVRTIRTRH